MQFEQEKPARRTPYQCKECGKAYAEHSACHKHVRTHKMRPPVPASTLIAVNRAEEEAAEAVEGGTVIVGGTDAEVTVKMDVIEEEEGEGEHELLEVVTEDGQKLRLEPGEQFIPGEQYILVETTGEGEEGGAGGLEPTLHLPAAGEIVVSDGGEEGAAVDAQDITYEVVEECDVAAADVTAPEA